MVGRMGTGMRQEVGLGIGARERIILWGECGASHCNQWGVCGVAVQKCVNRRSCGLGWCVGSAAASMYYMGVHVVHGEGEVLVWRRGLFPSYSGQSCCSFWRDMLLYRIACSAYAKSMTSFVCLSVCLSVMRLVDWDRWKWAHDRIGQCLIYLHVKAYLGRTIMCSRIPRRKTNGIAFGTCRIRLFTSWTETIASVQSSPQRLGVSLICNWLNWLGPFHRAIAVPSVTRCRCRRCRWCRGHRCAGGAR